MDTLLFQWRWQVVARIALANLDTSGMVTPIDTSLTGIFTDSRDKQPYKYVKLQSQTWMAQNLNYQSAGADSGWCYGNISANCDTYGRLYTWSAVMAGAASSTSNPSGVRGICPFGWHVPSDAEWTTLMGFTGGPGYAGAQLKSKTGWSPNDNGLDLYGFTGLPGGFRGYAETFGGLGNGGDFWSATENASNAWWRSLDANYPNMSRMDKDKIFGFSLRCVED